MLIGHMTVAFNTMLHTHTSRRYAPTTPILIGNDPYGTLRNVMHFGSIKFVLLP